MAKARSKHQRIVNDLEARLGDKRYVKSVIANYEYEKGECDILTHQGHRLIYYEVKSNYNKKSLKHAKVQLLRWSKYAHKHNGGIDCYGVYYTPTYVKLIAKNGVLRE